MKEIRLKKITYSTAAIIAAFAIIAANFAILNQPKQVDAAGLYDDIFMSDILPYGIEFGITKEPNVNSTLFIVRAVAGYNNGSTILGYMIPIDDNLYYQTDSLGVDINGEEGYAYLIYITTTDQFFIPKKIKQRKYNATDVNLLNDILTDLADEDFNEAFSNGAYTATYTLESVNGQIADFSVIIPYSEEAANYQFADSDFYYNQEMQNNNRLNYIITVLGIIVAVGTLLIVFKVI